MAKKSRSAAEAVSETPTTAPAASAGTRARIMITDPETGEQVARSEWIRRVYVQKGGKFYASRSAIAKHLEVPYQTIFGATRGLPNPETLRAEVAGAGEDAAANEGAAA